MGECPGCRVWPRKTTSLLCCLDVLGWILVVGAMALPNWLFVLYHYEYVIVRYANTGDAYEVHTNEYVINTGLYTGCYEQHDEHECDSISVGDHDGGGANAAQVLLPLGIICLTAAAALNLVSKLPKLALGFRVAACIFVVAGMAGAASSFSDLEKQSDGWVEEAKIYDPRITSAWKQSTIMRYPAMCLPLALTGSLVLLAGAAGAGIAVMTQRPPGSIRAEPDCCFKFWCPPCAVMMHEGPEVEAANCVFAWLFGCWFTMFCWSPKPQAPAAQQVLPVPEPSQQPIQGSTVPLQMPEQPAQ